MHKKKFPRICTSMHSGGFELTKLTYTRLRDNLIRHRGDRHHGSGPVGSDRIRRVFKYHASGPVGVGSNQKGFRISWVGSCWVGFQKPGLLTGDPDPDPTRPDPTRPDPTRPAREVIRGPVKSPFSKYLSLQKSCYGKAVPSLANSAISLEHHKLSKMTLQPH